MMKKILSKKPTCCEPKIVAQKRYPSGNPDLGTSNAIAQAVGSVKPCLSHWREPNTPQGEFTFTLKGGR